jgi:hypothetical protein
MFIIALKKNIFIVNKVNTVKLAIILKPIRKD